MKNFIKKFGIFVLSISCLLVVSFGLGLLGDGLYEAGKNAVKPQVVEQTLAILNLGNENSNLKTEILTLQGVNYELRILTQTQEDELDGLKTTVDSLNQSITELEGDNANMDDIITKLNSDVAYLNSYVSKLENTISQLRKDYIVMVLPSAFSKVSSIVTYQYNNLIYLHAFGVDDIYVYDIYLEEFSTCLKDEVFDLEYAVYFSDIWNGKLLFTSLNENSLCAIDLASNRLIKIFTDARFSNSKVNISYFYNDNILVVKGYSLTYIYDNNSQQTLSFSVVLSPYVLNNNLYFYNNFSMYCLNLNNFTYIQVKFTDLSTSSIQIKYNDFIHIWLGNAKKYYVLNYSLETITTSDITGYGAGSYYNFWFRSLGDYIFILTPTNIYYFESSTLTIEVIDVTLPSGYSAIQIKEFNNYALIYYSGSSYPGVYKFDTVNKTLILLNDAYTNLKWLYSSGFKHLVGIGTTTYVYDENECTFTEFSTEFSSLTLLLEKESFAYFYSGSKIYKVSLDLSSYEVYYTLSSPTTPHIVANYALMNVTGYGMYCFYFDTLEIVLVGTYINGSYSITLDDNGEDAWIKFSKGTYFFDYSEKSLNLYSYGVDLQ